MSFYNDILEIDAILENQEVSLGELNKLKSKLKDVSKLNYFWKNLKQVGWVKDLLKARYFEILSHSSISSNDLYQTQSFISDYLVKVSEIRPRDAVHIIRSVNSDNNRVLWNFSEIGLKVPAAYTAKMIPKVKQWIKSPHLSMTTNFTYEIAKWFSHLITANEFDAALTLLRILVTPKVEKPALRQNKELEAMFGKERPKAIPPLDHYYFTELLSKGLSNLVKEKPSEVVTILQASLEKAIKIEYGHLKETDLSGIWRAAIEDHPQNHDYSDYKVTLVIALRNAVEILTIDKTDQSIKLIIEYLEHKYSIFRRIGIHILRLYFTKYRELTYKLSQDITLLKDSNIYHEYYLLLKEHYGKLPEKNQERILDEILSYEVQDDNLNSDMKEKRYRYYLWEHLSYIKQYLKGENKLLFENLQSEFIGEELIDTVIWHGPVTYGETSPISFADMKAMNTSEIWDYLTSFKPSGKVRDSSSIEGLARTWSEIFKADPQRFLTTELSRLIEMKPSYSYWIMAVISEQLRTTNYSLYLEHIEDLLTLCNRLIRIENLPDILKYDYDVNFTAVKIRILDVIQALIKNHQKDFPLKYKDKIWNIIEYLCYYMEDPDEKRESESGLDSFTLALNSVRGTALHTAIDYALWYAFNNKNKVDTLNQPNRLEGEERVTILLEDKLNNKKADQSLAVHSTFGVFLPNLLYLNYNWVIQNINKIFPIEKDNENYWVAAWTGYINASRFYSDLFKILRPQFIKAIEYIENGIEMPASSGRIPEDAMAEHLIVACLNGIESVDDEDSILLRYISIPDHSSIKHAIQFISNMAKDEKIFHKGFSDKMETFWPQAKIIWETRIRIVKKELSNKRREKEDKYDWEFSKYISWLDDLPKEVTIAELESILSETIKINQRGWDLPDFLEYLSQQSIQYPEVAINLLKDLMHTKAPNYFYNGKEEEIQQILNNAIKTKTGESYNYASYIVNRFGEWGNYYFKDFWIKNINANNSTPNRRAKKPKASIKMNELIPVKDMIKCLEKKFNALWMESFGILEEQNVMLGEIRIKKDNKKEIILLKEKIHEMEVDVKKYRDKCHQNFNPEFMNIMKSDLNAFKNDVFGEELWTVRSSLHDMSNPELERYRESFDNTTPKEIYGCVDTILKKTNTYVRNVFPGIDLRDIKSIEDLKLKFLDDEDTLLSGVIGLGIRSELLHRMYPAAFPIMTRRSLWGMFFLTDENEFVVDESYKGKSRTSHQWNYEYDRFCFYANVLTNLMEKYLDKYKIKMDMSIRFGYLNLMLNEYSAKRKSEIEKLHTWKHTGL